ncbi:hypothetical protein R1sor_019141 [Riccia sorocarpa]|uniref:Integral membrane bound transporter domain-containing protein n=1 Tax=Riccia sorocarpa TaxID=122646 RepID=A0ABD3IHW2_9MARC
MKSPYWSRFFHKVTNGTRTGLGVLIVGMLFQYVRSLKQLVMFSTFTPVMTICVCDSTVGKAVRNFISVGFVSLFNTFAAIIVYQFLRPPIPNGVAIGCIGFFSFIVSYPSSLWLLSRKIGLAQVSILYVTAQVDPNMNTVIVPFKLLLSTTLGSAVGVVTLILPWPRLSVWEVLRIGKSTARSTSELMKAAVSAFSAPDEGSFSAIVLHAKMLRKAALESLEELTEKQPEIWWELRAGCLKMNRFNNMIHGLIGLNQHLTGMEMALHSGCVLQCPEVMRKMLEQPLKRVADHAAKLLDIATKSLAACSLFCSDGSATLNAEQRKALLEEGKLALLVLDTTLLEARKLAYYSSDDEPLQNEGTPEESTTPEGHTLKKPSTNIPPLVHQRFMVRLTVNFFIFSLRLYFEQALHLVDTDFKIYASMHQIARRHVRSWMPRRLSMIRFSGSPKMPIFEEPAERSKPSIDVAKIMGESEEAVLPNTSLKEELWSPEAASTSEQQSECSQCKTKLLARSAPDRYEGMKSWLIPRKAQVVKSTKLSMIMMLAAAFGNFVLPNDIHSCWAPVTVSFIIGNLQGGAYRLASLRIQGTVVGAIFGYLVVSELYAYKYLLPLILAVWVSLSDYIRYSKTHGYSGLVSSLTAAILMSADYNGKDIKAFAMDRIAMTFIGVACFVLIEPTILPERAVVLVREELLISLKRLRDCVAAIVAVYTSQGCAKCRTAAVNDMQKLEQQLRVGLVVQSSLRDEAVLEPDLWFVPFPVGVYSRLITTQKRMLDLLFFMVCSLQASTQDWSDDHMQKLLKPLRSSLTALEDEVLSTVDTLYKLLDKGSSSWNLLARLARILGAFRGLFHCVGDVEKGQKPGGRMSRVRRPIDVFEPSRRAARALLALGHRRRSIGGTPMRLKTTMERFEQTFESVLHDIMKAHSKTQEAAVGEGHVVSNSVMLSISSLSFCLHSLLQETVDLEKGVWELLQAENPLSVLDFWDEFGPSSPLYRQHPEEELHAHRPRSSWSAG